MCSSNVVWLGNLIVVKKNNELKIILVQLQQYDS